MAKNKPWCISDRRLAILAESSFESMSGNHMVDLRLALQELIELRVEHAELKTRLKEDMESKMLFDIIDDTDGTNVLGGSVPLDNCYIAMYAAIQAGEKLPKDLEVGESTRAEYRLGSSGAGGARPKARGHKSRAHIYRITRVA